MPPGCFSHELFGGAPPAFRLGAVIVLVAALLSAFHCAVCGLRECRSLFDVLNRRQPLLVVLAAPDRVERNCTEQARPFHIARWWAQLDNPASFGWQVWPYSSRRAGPQAGLTPPASPPPKPARSSTSSSRVKGTRIRHHAILQGSSSGWASACRGFRWRSNGRVNRLSGSTNTNSDTFGLVESASFVSVSNMPNVVVRPNGSRS